MRFSCPQNTWRVTTRLAAWLLTISTALVGHAVLGDDDDAPMIRDGFESARIVWNQEQTDASITPIKHDRTQRAAHNGLMSERIAFNSGVGSSLFFSYATPNVPVTKDLSLELFLRANRSGMQLFARVILPADTDPETKAPSYLLVPGTLYENTNHWQRLELIELQTAIDRQVRVLRATTKRPVSLEGAYVEQLVLNLYTGAGETEVFADPGPDETRDDYYRRQVRGTRNFLRSAKLDAALQRILEEEVPYQDRPDFRIFYGGLDTHIEHHLFPDLPPNRQREIAPRVKEIVSRHGLPYHETPLGETAGLLLKALTGLSAPVGEREAGHPLMLLRRPAGLARRLASGIRYRALPDAPYLDKPRWYNVGVRVVGTRRLAGARLIRLEKPRGWDDVCWDPGAFLSLCVPDGDDVLIRQYSLLHDSEGSDTMDICVKRVDGGRVSQLLNNDVRAGSYLTVLGPPLSTGGLATPEIPARALFIAGGVGITPVLSQLRKLARSGEPQDAVLLYFNRDTSSILFRSEIAELGTLPGITVHMFTGQRPSAQMLSELVPDAAGRETFACAPSGLVDAVRGYLADLGQAPDLFHTESFTAPEMSRAADDDGRRYVVRFARAGRTVEIDGTTTLLEAANRVGIRVPTGCRSGLCRACVTPKLSGITQKDGGKPLERVTVCDSTACSDIELDL